MIGIAVARGGRRNPEDEESGLLEFLAELEHITREEFHQRSAPPSFASSPAQSKTAKNVQAKHTDDFPPLFEKPKNSTQRLKLELQYLRGKVRDLETELGTVKRKREREREDQFGEAGPESVMERLAKRQLQERIESEKQNASLQATTQKQEKLISSVKKLLSKRQVCSCVGSTVTEDLTGVYCCRLGTTFKKLSGAMAKSLVNKTWRSLVSFCKVSIVVLRWRRQHYRQTGAPIFP